MAKDDLTKSVKDQVKHYEDAHYRQDFTPNPGDESMMGHNQLVWLQNECKRLVKERDEEHTLKKEAEQALAIALVGDHQQKEADELMMKKLERIQELEQINEDHHKLNGKLRVRITELENDNQKISKQIEDQLDRARKAGL
jgi:hypothetical protein|tara:strand:- start:321 stop:743 length:423 start_codon:yes stop_codon:yes gene_type:complete